MSKARQKLRPSPQPSIKSDQSTKGASAPLVVQGTEDVNEVAPPTVTQPAAHGQEPEAQAQAQPPAGPEPAIIVFGHNEHRIPQAAWFSASDAELATRAARLMGLRVLKIENDAHREAAALLRQGQVYASERTFAPVVSQVPFDKVMALAGQAGELSGSEVKPTVASSEPPPRPAAWADIAIGHVVLALENDDPEEDWFEASVIDITAEDSLVLRWRYSARDSSFTQPRSHVALLPVQKA